MNRSFIPDLPFPGRDRPFGQKDWLRGPGSPAQPGWAASARQRPAAGGVGWLLCSAHTAQGISRGSRCTTAGCCQAFEGPNVHLGLVGIEISTCPRCRLVTLTFQSWVRGLGCLQLLVALAGAGSAWPQVRRGRTTSPSTHL